MDTIGSLVDKLATINQKMFVAQDGLYVIRKMNFEEFKVAFGTDDGLEKLYGYFKKAMDLNLQRQAMILEVDQKISDMIMSVIKGENLNNGSFIQDQHKTY